MVPMRCCEWVRCNGLQLVGTLLQYEGAQLNRTDVVELYRMAVAGVHVPVRVLAPFLTSRMVSSPCLHAQTHAPARTRIRACAHTQMRRLPEPLALDIGKCACREAARAAAVAAVSALFTLSAMCWMSFRD